MIGKSNWFKSRKYTGWGLTPVTWQGWLYILGFILPIAILNSVLINQNIKNIFTIIWTGLLLIDVTHIMFQIKKDERESLHEAISDRNALWFMLTVLVVGIIYQATSQITAKNIAVDPIVVIALLGATIVKAATHFYLRDK